MKRKTKKIRNPYAQDALSRNSSGAMGKIGKSKNKSDRKKIKQRIKIGRIENENF